MPQQQPSPPLSVFDQLAADGHEQVLYSYDAATGLRAIIAIHNTVLGPALGGTRFWHYADDAAALTDVLRLAKGMTYKSAVAGLNLGGGKAVIVGDAMRHKTPALLRKYGQFVDTLQGRYIAAPDVNTTMQDMVEIAKVTPHVCVLPSAQGGSDDSSPATAYGTYLGMKAAAKHAYGTDQLQGKTVGVEGVGKVGSLLVERLCHEGARVYVTDIVQERLDALTQQYAVQAVSPQEFYDLPLDVYAPCALGATINDATLGRLRCQIIAGAANNQLADEVRHSQALLDRGIVYVPDFVISAGGVINAAAEVPGPYNREQAHQHVERLYDVCLAVLTQAAEAQQPPQAVAQQMAEQRIEKARMTQGQTGSI